jgi:N-acetylneuraminic acid mutarotase
VQWTSPCFRAVALFAAAACGSASKPFQWRAVAPCPVARFEAMAGVSGGKMLVMGGFTDATLNVTSRIDVYDPATDTWTAAQPLPSAQTHVAVASLGDSLVLAGGFVGPGASWHTTDEVWIRGADGSFVPGPTLPSPHAAATAAVLGGSVHVAGGLASDGLTDSGDHDSSTLPAAFQPLAPLPNPRNHLGGAAMGSSFYVVGGRHGWDEAAGDQTDLDRFDLATGQWTPLAPIPQAASEIAGATFAAGGRLVVVGGSIAGVHPTAKVWAYDPGANAWTALPDLPEPRKGAAAVAIGSSIVVSTGSPTSVDPSDKTWIGCCLP